MIQVRPLREPDRAWAAAVERREWGEPVAARLGELVGLDGLPGCVARRDGRRAGVTRYAVRGHECELVSIVAIEPGVGVGRALLEAVREAALAASCRRLWLITTNDNVRALRFYQRFGFDLAVLHHGAVARARRLKPAIPERGSDGIPIAHELEMRMEL
jgi:ribosomal protein S18 acetylase RimI-like enzyme